MDLGVQRDHEARRRRERRRRCREAAGEEARKKENGMRQYGSWVGGREAGLMEQKRTKWNRWQLTLEHI